MNFILGTKQKMTQIWQNDKVIAVTPVQAGPCVVSAIKTEKQDGYQAVQLAFGNRKSKNIRKPQLVQFKKLDISPKFVKEFRVETLPETLKLGDKVQADTFSAGETIQVTGVSKGKGFQGVVKRHGFGGSKATHGNKDQLRMPGSIGSTGPAHVFKGMRMPGRMGNDRVTLTNLEVAQVDEANNIIYIKGAVPGATNSLLMIKGKGELKLVSELKPKETTKEVKVEEVVAEKPEEAIEEKPAEVTEEKLDQDESKTEAKK